MPKRWKVAVAVLVVSLVGAACGSSSHSAQTGGGTSTSSPSATSGSGSAAPTGTPLVIGMVGSETSAALASPATIQPDTLAAWISWTNAHGGVAGHPVKAIYENDNGDPAQAVADVTKLVQQDHVLAIVGEYSNADEAIAPYTLTHRVPVIGGVPIDPTWFTNPMWYPVGGTVQTNLWGQMEAAKVAGAQKIGVLLCTEVPACAQAAPVFASEAKSIGLDVVYNALASQTQADYTAQCIAAKQAGVQAFAAYVNDVVLARDCVRQGFHALWIEAGYQSIQSITQVQAFGNTVGSSAEWACEGPVYPQTQAFNQAMAQYQPKYDKGTTKYNLEGPGSCDAWASAEAFAKAVTNADVAPTAQVTSADIIRGLSMFKNETLGGYLPNITYNDGTTANPVQSCIYLYKYEGTNFIPVPTGVNKYSCQPPPA
jgi:branched-chain amino acid transport system substrate-binding protein